MTLPQFIAAITAALGLAGVVALSLYLGTATNGIPNPITVDGETITFTYTDDNTDEDLIIYTSTSTYKDGFSHATVYAAVLNTTNRPQSVELAAYFGDESKRIESVFVLTEVTQEFKEPVWRQDCVDGSVDVGGVPSSTRTCTMTQTGTTTRQETKNVWAPLDLLVRGEGERTKEEEWLKRPRKAVEGFTAPEKSVAFPINRDRAAYYKIEVEFPPNQRDEFMIEAIGDNGAYGFLR